MCNNCDDFGFITVHYTNGHQRARPCEDCNPNWQRTRIGLMVDNARREKEEQMVDNWNDNKYNVHVQKLPNTVFAPQRIGTCLLDQTFHGEANKWHVKLKLEGGQEFFNMKKHLVKYADAAEMTEEIGQTRVRKIELLKYIMRRLDIDFPGTRTHTRVSSCSCTDWDSPAVEMDTMRRLARQLGIPGVAVSKFHKAKNCSSAV